MVLAELLRESDIGLVSVVQDRRRRQGDRHRETMVVRRARYVAAGKVNKTTRGQALSVPVLDRPIRFLDGEGLDTGPQLEFQNWKQRHAKGTGGKHSTYQAQDYVLLAARGDDGTSIELKHPNYARLTTEECLSWLLQLGKPGVFNVGFGLSYDVSQWLKDVPLKNILRWKEDPDSRMHWKHWDITYLPNRMIRITRKLSKRQRELTPDQKSPTVQIWDSRLFFQSSFVTAATKWNLLEGRDTEFLTYMKAERENFTEEMMPTVEKYNELECDIGIDMFARVREYCIKLGLHMTSWNGAGSIAQAMLRQNGVLEYMERSSPGMQNPWDSSLECDLCPEHRHLCGDIIARAYYGGRFDYSMQGNLGDVFEYDINSAYPFEASRLPCLTHARWQRHTGYRDVRYGIYRVEWDSARTWSPFPYRRPNGDIEYLASGAGYYWKREVEVAHKFANVDILETWELVVECDHKPFAWIQEYYNERQRMLNPEAYDFGEKIIKLGLNAIYGKLAQEQLRSDRLPPFQNYIWAGMITSNTRARLMELCALSPQNITHMATDGIYSRIKLPVVPDNSQLGAWGFKELTDLVLVCNGMYATGEKKATRGYAPKQIPWKAITEQFARGDFETPIPVRDHDFINIASITNETDYERRCMWRTSDGRMQVKPPAWKERINGWLAPRMNPEPHVLSESSGRSHKIIQVVTDNTTSSSNKGSSSDK